MLEPESPTFDIKKEMLFTKKKTFKHCNLTFFFSINSLAKTVVRGTVAYHFKLPLPFFIDLL